MIPNSIGRKCIVLLVAIGALAVSACHREVAVPPIKERAITFTDQFFDVWPTSPTRAFIVGTRGKVLLTEDGGLHFKQIDIGTDLAVFGIQMVDDQYGYLCGQDGLIMRTHDGGKTWQRINSRTQFIYFLALLSRSPARILCRRRLPGAQHHRRRRNVSEAPVRAPVSCRSFRTTRFHSKSRSFMASPSLTIIADGSLASWAGFGRPTTAARPGRSSRIRWSRNGSVRSAPTTIPASPIFSSRACSAYPSAMPSMAPRAGSKDG